MRLALGLVLSMLAALGCASEPAEKPQQQPSPTPATTPAGDKVAIVGGAEIARVLHPEWKVVHDYTRQFYESDLAQLYARFTPELQNEWPLDKFTAYRDQRLTGFGSETKVLAEHKEEKQGYRAFFRAAQFANSDATVELAWVLNETDQIAGFSFLAAGEAPAAEPSAP